MRVFPEGTEMALKDLMVRNAKPRDSAYKLSDAAGLYVYVSPSGGKLWRWDYRFEGKGKTMAFGKYPDVPLALARERHAGGRQILTTGVDPMDHRNSAKTD